MYLLNFKNYNIDFNMKNVDIRLEQLTVEHDLANYVEMVNDKENTHSIEGIDNEIMKRKI